MLHDWIRQTDPITSSLFQNAYTWSTVPDTAWCTFQFQCLELTAALLNWVQMFSYYLIFHPSRFVKFREQKSRTEWHLARTNVTFIRHWVWLEIIPCAGLRKCTVTVNIPLSIFTLQLCIIYCIKGRFQELLTGTMVNSLPLWWMPMMHSDFCNHKKRSAYLCLWYAHHVLYFCCSNQTNFHCDDCCLTLQSQLQIHSWQILSYHGRYL